MKIFYLDCGGRTRFTTKLINHLLKHDYDIIFLADAINIVDDIKSSLPNYKLNKTNYQYGINVLSKDIVKITDFPLKSNHNEVDKKYTMDKYKERLISVEYFDKRFIVVKAPKRKPYKQIYIVNLIKIMKTINPDLVIANLVKGGKLEMEMTVSNGRGYVDSKANQKLLGENYEQIKREYKKYLKEIILCNNTLFTIYTVLRNNRCYCRTCRCRILSLHALCNGTSRYLFLDTLFSAHRWSSHCR
mgnify:CR=1 FL=1